ncbi:hypothetical protein GI374_18700 [Paracoccus sp. S-4012]|nr:hypothetical protein [Paracoccus sp. S-4012]
MFSYVDLEARIPARHPLRKIRQVVNDALTEPHRVSRRPVCLSYAAMAGVSLAA